MFNPVIRFIDNRLNRITMYRLILYYLIALLGIAEVFSALHILPYNPINLLLTIVFLLAACWVTNTVFAKTFRVPTNVESVYISALILALIITPLTSVHDLLFLGWAAVWAMASKYILAIKGKHLFNPVGFAVALTAITVNQTASWWVADASMLAFVIIGGLLVVRKIRRFHLVASFLAGAVVTISVLTVLNGGNLLTTLQRTALYSPLFFFAFVIITEPLTTPPTQRLQMVYGALVGVLFSPEIHVGGFYLTPELALLIGNVFSYLVSPKTKLVLRLKQKIQIGPDLYDFIFATNRKLSFAPGQYMEWTLGHTRPDNRGNRRYFTLASSPTENDLRVGVKFYPNSSSYKTAMLSMNADTQIVAAQLAGDFVLPADPQQKVVFIAGGIGITPFRSMIKFLLDNNQRRPITLFYASRTADEIVYRDVFNLAQQRLGIKTVYTITDTSRIPAGWNGQVGYINPRMIKNEVPNYKKCMFYLSGPNSMVEAFEDTLIKMGVHRDQIKTDFFPGFA